MANDKASDPDIVQKPNLKLIRQYLLTGLDQALNDWNKIVSLKYADLIEDRGRVIIAFMEKIVHAIALAIHIKKEEIDHKYWKWNVEKEFPNNLRLIELILEENELREGKEYIFLNDSLEYATMKNNSYILHDRCLVLKAWLPAFDQNTELVFLFRIIVPPNRILTNEVGSIIETYYEFLLTGIRTADYISTKKLFFSSVQHRIPNKQLVFICENLLYLEAWRSLWNTSSVGERKITKGFDSWFTPDGESVELDNADQDYVLSSYLASLLYLTNQGETWAKNRLKNALQRTTGDDLLINLPRGPGIRAKVAMQRTYYIVAQAKILFSSQRFSDRERNRNDWRRSLGIDSGIYQFQQARRLKGLWSIIELEAHKLSDGKPLTETRLKNVVMDALSLANEMKPLLDQALRNSGGCIELSSRWLDTWFGLRLLESKVLPQDHLENYESSRIVELVSYWARYFRYLLDYFVLRQTPAGNHGWPDLPTEPANDAVERAQLNLICEWAHDQGVPRAIPLQAWLSKTYETELALYSLSGKGSYRQHIFHVQDVSLLGCVLLFGKWSSGQTTEPFWTFLARVSGLNQEALFCNWLVASLLHDIGYGLQVVPRGLEALPEGIIKGLEELVKDIEHKLKQTPPRTVDFDPTPTRADGKLEISDHAHVSMVAILAQLRSLSDQWQLASAYNPAMAAIVDHGSKDSPIDYTADPLSAIIVICDQLQDWGRIRLDTSLLANSFLANLCRAPDEEPDPMIIKKLFSSSRLYIKVDGLDENCNLVHPAQDGKLVMKFLIHGPYAGESGYEPAIAWLDFCRAFQRICLPLTAAKDGLLPEICITLQHGISAGEIPELHRLERFAHDNEEQRGVILDWLTQVRKCGVIQYGCSQHPHPLIPETLLPEDMRYDCYEWIEYTIPSINRQGDRPLKNLPEKLYKTYREFRKKETARKRG